MQVVIDLVDEFYDWIKNGYPGGEDARAIFDAVRRGTVLPKGHGDLIDRYDAIKAVYDRHEYLMNDPIYRKKTGNQIDLIGVTRHIWDIAPIVAKDKEDKDASSN